MYRVVESVDDLGDTEDNSTCVLVQPGTQSHLILIMIDIDANMTAKRDTIYNNNVIFSGVHLRETHNKPKVLTSHFRVVLEEAVGEGSSIDILMIYSILVYSDILVARRYSK